MFKRVIVHIILASFLTTSIGPVSQAMAQTVMDLPAPGVMVGFSPKFNQATLKGIVFYPKNPYKFDFVLDQGDRDLNEDQSKEESKKIAMYFLASLTTPENEIWVNLSPFEKGRIIPSAFGHTLMGQNLLAQDYMLKQIMASALYPERALGREFWQKVYQQARIKFGTTDIPFDTFNKVWIVPDKAFVYENTKMNAVFVADSSLKVMLEKDYLAQSKNTLRLGISNPKHAITSSISTAAIRELVIPALEKEVNEGKNFAPLRQVYNALILAKWYKENLTHNIIAQGYINRNKTAGIAGSDQRRIESIYNQYLKAYKRGVFNYIKEDLDATTQNIIPRKYFSGGFMGKVHPIRVNDAMKAREMIKGVIVRILLSVLTLGSVSQGAVAKTSNEALLQAVGVHSVTTIPLTEEENKKLLDILEKAADKGEGDEKELIDALRRTGASANQYARKMLRLSTRPSWDAVISTIFSANNGFFTGGLAAGATGGVSTALGVSNNALYTAFDETVKLIRERNNIGSTTVRLEAASHLLRYPDTEASDVLRFMEKDAFGSLNPEHESDDTVKALRLLTMAAIISNGYVPREIASGNGIPHLDQVFKEAQSQNMMVRYAALAVFAAIKTNDPDNRFRDWIAQLIQKGSKDIVTSNILISLVVKHHISTQLDTIVNNMAGMFKDRPNGTDSIASIHWDEQMRETMRYLSQLIRLHPDQYSAYLGFMNEQWTGSGSTDMFNFFNLGIRFAMVQSAAPADQEQKKKEFMDYLNQEREQNGLLSVNSEAITIETGDVAEYLAGLRNGKNVEANFLDVIRKGGPLYFPELINILEHFRNPEMLKAFAEHLNEILTMGVYPSENVFTQILTDHLKGDDRGNAMAIMEGASLTGVAGLNTISAAVHFMFTQHYDPMDVMENGQSNVFFHAVTALAQMMVHSRGITDAQINQIIDRQAGSEPTAVLKKGLLIQAIQAVRDGKNPMDVLVPATWPQVGKDFLTYITTGSGDPQTIAKDLDASYNALRSDADPNSGSAIVARLVSDPKYRGHQDIVRMLDVLEKVQHQEIALKAIITLFGFFPDSDQRILAVVAHRNSNGISGSIDTILNEYLKVFSNMGLENPESLQYEESMRRGLGRLPQGVLNAAIDRRLPTANPLERSALISLKTESLDGHSSYSRYLTGMYELKGDVLLALLNDMKQKQWPSYYLRFFLSALSSHLFARQDIHIALEELIARLSINRQSSIPAARWEEYRNFYLENFKNQKSPENKQQAFLLFFGLPSEMVGELVVEAVRTLHETYPDMSNATQRDAFFKVLRDIKYQLTAIVKNQDSQTYATILQHFKQYLDANIPTHEFESGVAEVLIFAQSLVVGDKDNVDLFDHFNFGFRETGINFSGVFQADKTYYDFVDGEIPQAYLLLEKILVRVIQSGKNFKLYLPDVFPENERQEISALEITPTPLEDLQLLLTPPQDRSSQWRSTHVGQSSQIAAMVHLGERALLFAHQVSFKDSDSVLAFTYLQSQFSFSSDAPQTFLSSTTVTSNQVGILNVAVTMNRGQGEYNKNLANLGNNEFVKDHPIEANEIVRQIGLQARAGSMRILIEAYKSNPFTWGFSRQFSYYEETLVKAMEAIGNTVQERNELGDYIATLPASDWLLKRRLSTILKSIPKNNATSKAMIAPKKGGIDLENVYLQVKSKGHIQTAFDDPAQLAVLIKSDGFVITVEDLSPLSGLLIHQLLGTTP